MTSITGDDGDNVLTGSDTQFGQLFQVSTNALGDPANNISFNPYFSSDGTMVAFASKASNLVAGDTNGDFDIYVKNLTTGAVTLVSVTKDGVIGNDKSVEPVFSPDGTKVVFSSAASNLVADDTNGTRDIFLKDLVTGDLTRISLDSNGGQQIGASIEPTFSPDGSKVAFYSYAPFSPTDTNGARDIYIKDLNTGQIVLASCAADGTPGNTASVDATFSPDGTKLLFASASDNLVAGDTNGLLDVFLKDLVTGDITLVSTSASGEQGNDKSGQYYTSLAFSPDGKLVAFSSEASNFVAGDTNDAPDVFVKNLLTGEIQCLSVNAAGEFGNGSSGVTESTIQFSPDGKSVIFSSDASNLVANDTNGHSDVFIRNLATGVIARVSVDQQGNQAGGDSSREQYSSDGTKVVFQADGTFGSGGGGGGRTQVYIKVLPTDGDDIIDGGKGNDQLYGNSGNDVLIGGRGNDVLDGGVGFDTADYSTARTGVTVSLAGHPHWQDTGGAGTDRLSGIEAVIGSPHDDHITGSNGDDVLSGRGGADVLKGGAGRDFLSGGVGNDVLSGGSGIDTADYSDARTAVSLDLAHNGPQDTGGAGFDTLSGIENLVGSNHDDHLVGSAADNRLDGSSGDDLLNGGAGNDALVGGVGDDTLIGGLGNDDLDGGDGDGDTVSYADAPSSITVYLDARHGAQDTGGAGIDTLHWIENLIGSSHDDALYGSISANIIHAGNGNDFVSGYIGADTLYGESGNDTVDGDVGNDTLDGGNGNDQLNGGSGDDVVTGGVGDDVLNGNHDADVLHGDAGDDVITGGEGADRLFGGSGADTFVYLQISDSGPNGATCDVIMDFETGRDKIDLSAIDATADKHQRAFTFVDAFTGHAGELLVAVTPHGYLVAGDTNGDAVADFTIRVHGAAAPTAADFIL